MPARAKCTCASPRRRPRHSCFYGVDTPERAKLLAAQMNVEQMRDYINADSLAFISIEGLYRALGEERDDAQPQRCDACFTGDYPTSADRRCGKRTARRAVPGREPLSR